MTDHIFISYSKKDSDFALKLAEDLQEAGFKIWIDRSIGGGEDWRETIEENLKAAEEVIIVVSPNSMDSEWVRHEGSLAYGWEKQLFPVLMTPVDALPPWLEEYQWVDFVDTPYEAAFDALVADLTPPNPIQDLLGQEVETYHQTGDLMSEAVLSVIEESWDTLEISGEAEALIQESREQREKEKAEREAQRQRELEQAKKLAKTQQQRVLVLAAGLVVAVILGIVAFSFFQQARENLQSANVRGTQVADSAATAEARRVEADNARATAVEDRNAAATAQVVAEQNQEEAEEQTIKARAGALSSLALAQLDQHLDLGLLLSVEAFKNRDILQTQKALFTAWNHNLRLNRFLQMHTDRALSVAWSPDGQLASASADNTVIVWDLESGRPAQILDGHKDSIESVAWSPHGRLASASWDNTIIVWDLENGQPAQTLRGHTSTVWGVAWSPNGRLASASGDGTVIIWNLQSGQPAQILHGHTDVVRDVAWSPDGKLASSSDDTTIIIWDLESNEPAQTLLGHTDTVWSMDWSPNGRLASASYDTTVIIWNLQSGQPAQTLHGHTDKVWGVTWSSDNQLASSSEDNTIIIWNLESGYPDQVLQGHTLLVRSVDWYSDSQLSSASFDNNIIVWNTSNSLKTDKYNIQPSQILQGDQASILSVAWFPNEQLASGGCGKEDEDGFCVQGEIIIWDMESGQPTQTLRGHIDRVRSVNWSFDGKLASASNDDTIIIWDLESGQSVQTLQGHQDDVITVAWSTDGQLASGSCNKKDEDGNCIQSEIIIWNLENGQPAQIIQGHTDRVTSVGWSPDGRLASGSCDQRDDDTSFCIQGEIIVWDLESGQPAQILHNYRGDVTSIAWSPNGKLASESCDETGEFGECVKTDIIIWDLESGEMDKILQGHSGIVYSMAWSSDGRLASVSDDLFTMNDGSVIIWDLESGQPSQTIQGHTGMSGGVVWSPDGRLASTLDYILDNDTINVWEMNPAVWIEKNCRRAGRNLTQAEWDQYLSWKDDYQKTCPQWPVGKGVEE